MYGAQAKTLTILWRVLAKPGICRAEYKELQSLDKAKPPVPIWARVYAVALIAAGLPLLVGGAYLYSLGGSAYYALAGLATLGAALLIWMGRGAGALVYVTLLLVTTVWSVWEAGTNGWALAARLIAPVVLGLPMVFVLTNSRFHRQPRTRLRGLALLSVVLTVLASLGALAMRPADPPDPLFQTGQLAAALLEPAAPAAPGPIGTAGADWLHYGGDAGGTRHSSLAQINLSNVGRLEEAWRARIGPTSGLETTPLKIRDTLFVCNAYNDVFALDAENGKVRWRFDAHVQLAKVPYTVCRGVAYYRVADQVGTCAERILTNTVDARLIALDAKTGQLCPGFGNKGQVSLFDGMGADHPEFYAVTSAPTVVRGKVVLGGWVSDGMQWGEPSGVVRAFDAVTGRLAWAWDIGRPDRQTLPPAGESYTPSTPNAWAPFSADEQLGLVYVPTGNPAVDYFGGKRRPFDEALGSSVVAIDAQTGKTRWSFQTVHHDLWDWDVGSQPTLVDIPEPGGVRHALIQPTKRGEVFVLDRLTGKPIKPVAERPVPQGGIVPGERLSPTQPFSLGMPSFRGPDLTEKTMWGVTPLDHLWCRIRFREARYEGTATPPGFRPNIAYPGFNGGIDWGSVAVDPARQIVIVNSNRVANYDQIITRAEADRRRFGEVTKHGALDAPQLNTPYGAIIRVFTSPLGIPCNQPPFGKLAAVDLQSGKLMWQKDFGLATKAGPWGMRSGVPLTIGTPNNGGALTTASGLTFIGATQDSQFRAMDTRTGEVLWRWDLGAGGQAGPITYISPASGRQFVAIAAGGNPILGSVPGDSIVAFRLRP